jgi:hypothetical protein
LKELSSTLDVPSGTVLVDPSSGIACDRDPCHVRMLSATNYLDGSLQVSDVAIHDLDFLENKLPAADNFMDDKFVCSSALFSELRCPVDDNVGNDSGIGSLATPSHTIKK